MSTMATALMPALFNVHAFSADTFNSLPHVDNLPHKEESQRAREACLNGLKSVIYRHKLLDAVGITLTHKHMDVRENEVVVGCYDEADNKIVMNWHALQGDDHLYLFPFQFVFHVEKGWIPTAFWDIRTSGGQELKAKAEMLLNAHAFFREFAETVSAVSLDGGYSPDFGVFGLTVLFQSVVKGYGIEAMLVESTDVENRNQWFRLMTPSGTGESMIHTIWSWKPKPNGEEPMMDSCTFIGCRHHQWTHEHDVVHR